MATYEQLRVIFTQNYKDSSDKQTVPKDKTSTGFEFLKGIKISHATASVTAAATIVNSSVGAYTGNKIRQSNMQTCINLGAFATTLIANPLVGIYSGVAFGVKRLIEKGIEDMNTTQEQKYRTSYMGKMTTSGSRWSGGK